MVALKVEICKYHTLIPKVAHVVRRTFNRVNVCACTSHMTLGINARVPQHGITINFLKANFFSAKLFYTALIKGTEWVKIQSLINFKYKNSCFNNFNHLFNLFSLFSFLSLLRFVLSIY
ncbi:hypothetical protein BpHYR1_046743 [Brachionus plicatilis]|uniref:Uncharacterized protein n=1 Tax=Brachionus plicatilis TaxID=10195 RepID=A0A3M7PMY6_BRAPC|nr:hypothetical protein BpHYR1_046743 [Brachionus plicatilis]